MHCFGLDLLSLPVAGMAMDSASVYMCFPCYQEFDTLEEVLAHQLTCTTENVGSGAPTPISIPFLQTQVIVEASNSMDILN